jgi:predicted dehydrogenase
VTKKIRLAVAGAGAFGREHLKAIARLADITLAGVADVHLPAAEAASAAAGGVPTATDPGELLDRVQPDGLIVATPGNTHVAVATAALARGIPVLLEKPVAPTRAESAALVKAAAESTGFVLPGHILRFSDAHRRFADIVRSGTLGRVLSISARRHRDDSHAVRYRDDPVLMTMIHDIDLAIWLTAGAPAGKVLATRAPGETSRSETIATVARADAPTWRFSTAWTFPPISQPPDRIEVIGENGSAELDAGIAIRTYGAKPAVVDISGGDPDQAILTEVTYFADCIRSARKPAAVTLPEAVAGLAVADAIMASLASGGLATLTP